MIPESGAYVIAYLLTEDAEFAAGSLPPALYPAGLYAYAGRASRYLPARLKRQIEVAPTALHWHVDYLKLAGATATGVWILPDPDDECRAAKWLAEVDGVTVPARGFGSSDCESGCLAHLFHLGECDWERLLGGMAIALGGWRVRD